MWNGQPLPDDQSDGFKLCSLMEAPKDTWYARRIFNPNASISRRPVGPDLYIQQQNIHLGNHTSTTGSKGYGPTVKLIAQERISLWKDCTGEPSTHMIRRH